MPTRLDEDPPEIPVWQGILRHNSTPGYAMGFLEQNPAYGTAQPFTYRRCVSVTDLFTLILTLATTPLSAQKVVGDFEG
jgi:hypothetical protein